jgi:hypothetical protein
VREAVFVRRAAVPDEWLDAHDLPVRWHEGEAPLLPDTPRPAPILGIPRVVAPLAELDQALLLMRAGADARALERARDAGRLAPDDPEASALIGVLLERLGRPDEARAALERSLASSRYNRLADEARAALDRL